MASSAEVKPVADFARSAVPEGQGSSGLHIALIIIGGTIGFSIFIVAAQIGGALGFSGAAAAFALGSLILGTMGAITSYVGAKSRLSTYLLTEFAFGSTGAKIANLAVALSLIGWFGVISNILGQATHSMILESIGISIPVYLCILIASVLMIGVTVMGFTGIDRLALILVPIMIVFIGWAAYLAWQQSGDTTTALQTSDFTFRTAVSAVVGSYISGVIIQPDYSRFARNIRSAVIAVFIALGVVFPLIQFFSAVPSMMMGIPDIIQVMIGLGIIVPAFFLLLLGAWSSNVLCLYSSGLSIATIIQKVKLASIILGIGIVGTVLAFLPAQDYLIGFLVLLGITIPPIGAIYIIEAIFIRKFDLSIERLEREPSINWNAFVAWTLAIVVGYLSTNDIFGIVNIGSLDSLIVSSFVYAGLSWIRMSKPQAVT